MQERIGPVTQLRGAARALGRRSGVAVAATSRRGALDALDAARRAALRGLQLTGARGRRLVRRRRPGRPAGRPAPGGRRVAVLGLRAARASGSSCSGTRPPSSSSTADRPLALVVVRLCDVAPDGTLDADRARRAQPHASRRATTASSRSRPGEPVRVARPDAVDRLRGARRPRAAARGLADLLAVGLAVARAGDADGRGRRRSSCRCAGRPRSTPGCAPFGAPEAAPGLAKETLASGRTGRIVHRDLATGRRGLEFAWIDQPLARSTDSGDRARRAQRRPLPAGRGRPAVGGGRAARSRSSSARGDWAHRASRSRSAMTCDARRASSSPRGSTRYEGADALPRAPLDARDPAGRRDERPAHARGAGTRTRRSRAASATGSSCALAVRGPRGRADRARLATSPTQVGGLPGRAHARPRRRRCARSPTSAATAARSSRAARASAGRSSAPTTPGPTASTAACAPRRARATTRASTPRGSGSCRWRSAPGARSCSSTPTPDAAPLADGARRPARRRAPRTASTSTRCASTTASSTRSGRTGRSRSRTTSSATTASSTTRASSRVIDDRRLAIEAAGAAREPVQPGAPGPRRSPAGAIPQRPVPPAASRR